MQCSSEDAAQLKKRMQCKSVGCRVAQQGAALSLAVCSVVQDCSITKQDAAQLRKLQISSKRCNVDQETSTIISKSQNAGMPGKMLVRHRHFYGQSTMLVRHRHSGFKVSPVPLVTDQSSIAQLCKLKLFFDFLLHFGNIWTICISKNQSETLPALLQN